MKKFAKASVAASIVGVSMFAAASAFASSGTIDISGKVEDSVCNIEATGNAVGNTLVLPTVFKSELASDGATAGATGFQFAMTGCPTTGSVSAYFEITNVDSTTGNLVNKAAVPAENVQVQIMNADGEVIDLNTNSYNGVVALDTAGAATIDYSAQYIAKGGAATAGDVETQLVYTVRYQ
jgi:major type 1 subunit fimbrin (pilin)